MKIEFDEAEHRYVVDGEDYPSVTTVLAERFGAGLRFVPPDRLEAARVLGTHVHTAVSLFCQDELDVTALDAALVPYVEAWRQFMWRTAAVVVSSEVRVASKRYRYAGTFDVMAILRNRGAYLIDIKSGVVPDSVGPQAAAYLNAYSEQAEQPVVPGPLRRACLQLRDDGQFRFKELDDPADWPTFQMCLKSWRERNA